MIVIAKKVRNIREVNRQVAEGIDLVHERKTQRIVDVQRAMGELTYQRWLVVLALIGKGERNAQTYYNQLIGLADRLEADAVDLTQKAAEKGQEDLWELFRRVVPYAFWQRAFRQDPRFALLGEAAELVPSVDREKDKWKKAKPVRPGQLPPAGIQAPSVKAVKRVRQQQAVAAIQARIARSGLRQRVELATRLVTDHAGTARMIAAEVAKGTDPEKIAKMVAPKVRNVSATAQRLVRMSLSSLQESFTEEAMDQFSNVVIGYQVRNPMDGNTRPAHAKRAGRIYWKAGHHPESPYRAEDRPELPDAPNCRCRTSPIFAPEAGLDDFRLDDDAYAQWYAQQPPEVQQKVVGKGRWKAAAKQGLQGDYHRFVDSSGKKFIQTKTFQRKMASLGGPMKLPLKRN
jgi:hypothetical protein